MINVLENPKKSSKITQRLFKTHKTNLKNFNKKKTNLMFLRNVFNLHNLATTRSSLTRRLIEIS